MTRWLMGLLFFGLLVAGLSTAITLKNLPPAEELFSRRVVQSTKIYDRSGAVLLFEIHGEEKRTVIPYEEIPPAVKNATVAIEDAGFWSHRGVDFSGIARALLADLAARDFRQGGSTITQQLVKNAILGRERTLYRKIREALYAMALEAKLPKEKILDLYLNQIPYGQNAYGIQAAAQTFFGKHARDLGVREAALLAALPAAPSYYSPYGQHKDELLARTDRALERMAKLGYLDAQEVGRIKAQPLRFLPQARNIRAPHFVMYVREQLLKRYSEEEIMQDGLRVTTALDWKLQESAESIVSQQAQRNEKLIKAHNMALVAIDPRSGEILSMVGSRDYFDLERDGNFNVATALRQPGSAFKPFVYATALKKGLEPETVLFDVPTEFNPGCTPQGQPRPDSGVKLEDCYHPQNYDDTFRGPVTLRQAVAQSLNVPSVKVLYLAGVEDSIRTAESLGITSLGERSRFGLSLVLGGAEVRLLELVSAYGGLANDGILNPLTAILKVEAADGRVLESKQYQPQPVLDTEISRMISELLSDNAARVPVFQPNSSLYFPNRQVAAKTGTTQDFRDAWTIGYTPSLVAGVWAGNNDNTPMQQKGSGVMAAAPAWRQFMDFGLKTHPAEDFPAPAEREVVKPILKGLWQGEVILILDRISGRRATEHTPPETRLEMAFGEPHDPLFWIDRADVTGLPPADPTSDPQYSNWEYAFRAWLLGSGFTPRSRSQMPSQYDDVHTPEKQPRLRVEQKLDLEGNLTLRVNGEVSYALRDLSVLVDNKVISSQVKPTLPLELKLRPEQWPEGTELEVRAYDTVGNIGRAAVPRP